MSTLADRLGAGRRSGWPRPAGGTGFGKLFALLRAWHSRIVARAELARLSERELRDIGLTPGDAAREYAKPFWRA